MTLMKKLINYIKTFFKGDFVDKVYENCKACEGLR